MNAILQGILDKLNDNPRTEAKLLALLLQDAADKCIPYQELGFSSTIYVPKLGTVTPKRLILTWVSKGLTDTKTRCRTKNCCNPLHFSALYDELIKDVIDTVNTGEVTLQTIEKMRSLNMSEAHIKMAEFHYRKRLQAIQASQPDELEFRILKDEVLNYLLPALERGETLDKESLDKIAEYNKLTN